MNRKLKNTLVLIVLFVLIVAAGIVYNYIIQKNSISDRETRLSKLKTFNYQTSEITKQLEDLSQRANVLDSLLASRRFNIPFNLSSIKFFNFMNSISTSFSPVTKFNVEYIDKFDVKDFTYYEYKITGNGEYNDIFKFSIYKDNEKYSLYKDNESIFSTANLEKEVSDRNINEIVTDKEIYYAKKLLLTVRLRLLIK